MEFGNEQDVGKSMMSATRDRKVGNVEDNSVGMSHACRGRYRGCL